MGSGGAPGSTGAKLAVAGIAAFAPQVVAQRWWLRGHATLSVF